MNLLQRASVLFFAVLGAFLAAAAAFLAVGLNFAIVGLVALFGAVLFGVLRARQIGMTRAGQRRPARRLNLILVGLPILLIALFAAGTLYALYVSGQLAMPTDDWLANFDRLTLAIEQVYPYFEAKGVNWAALREQYRPQVAAAVTDADYYAVVAAMLAELRDGHTYLDWPFPEARWRFGSLMPVRDAAGNEQAVVRTVAAGTEGIAPGDVVTAIDGQPLDTALLRVPSRLASGSTPANSRALALDNALTIWDRADAMIVTVIGSDGQPRDVTLRAAASGEAENLPRAVSGETLPSGIGLIRIPTLSGNRARLVSEFDAALAALPDAPGLILDLRGNGGGNSQTGAEMAGRFLASDFEYGREYYRLRLPARAWLGSSTRTVAARGPQDTRPVILLTDALTASSAEELVMMLVDSGRARTVGRTTSGSSGNPLRVPLTGEGRAQFSAGDLRRVNGERVEGQGIAPTVAVEWTAEDVRQGRDPDIAAAEALLLGR